MLRPHRTSSPAVVRRLRVSDADAYLELVGETEGPEYRLKDVLARNTVWGAFRAARLLGVAHVGNPEGDSEPAILWGMWVATDCRRQGIGLAVLEEVQQATRTGLKLFVLPGNQPAIELYRRSGFVIVGSDASTVIMASGVMHGSTTTQRSV